MIRDAFSCNSDHPDVTRIAPHPRTVLADYAAGLSNSLVEILCGRFGSLFYFSCTGQRWTSQAEYQQKE